jgi:hypothetical protein
MIEFVAGIISLILIIVFLLIYVRLNGIYKILRFFKEQHEIKKKMDMYWTCPNCETKVQNTTYECINCGYRLK